MTINQSEPTEAEFAAMTPEQLDAYADTFDQEVPVEPAKRRLDAAISVRFAADELDQLREQADAAGMKVTAYIRSVVLQGTAGGFIDLAGIRIHLGQIAREVRELETRLPV